MFTVFKEVVSRSGANLANLPAKVHAATGHTVSWMLSTNKDETYHNPRFDTTTEHPITIYFVHGTGDYPRSFHWLMKHFIDSLPPHVIAIRCIAFEGRFQNTTIQVYAAQLGKKITDYGDKDIIFVGHSRGNLVIQNAVLSDIDTSKIRTRGIIALCPPSLGSPGASLLSFVQGSLGQMAMNSQYLCALNNAFTRVLISERIRYYPVFAENDLLVIEKPPIDANNPFTANSFTFSKLDHLSVMSSLEVATYLKNTFRQLLCVSAATEESNSLISKHLEAIKSEIVRLQSTPHLLSPIPKIQILVKLMMRLDKEVSVDNNASGVIAAFLKDATVTVSLGLENTNPLEVLRHKLNGPNFETESRTSAVVLDLRLLKIVVENDAGNPARHSATL